jgi:hypothetical protein
MRLRGEWRLIGAVDPRHIRNLVAVVQMNNVGYARRSDPMEFGSDSSFLRVLPHQPAGFIRESSMEC